MRYKVCPLLIGDFTITFNVPGVKFPKVNDVPTLIFLLIDENGEAIVVDTGFDINYVPGLDSYGRIEPEQEIPYLLKHAGIDPLNVKKLIMTHLHWDHAAGIKNFPNAEIFVQQAEIEALFNLRDNEETTFCPGHWIDRLDSFILIDGTKNILPGIEVIRTGIHTKGHQAIKIQGMEKSILLIGDTFSTNEWLWTLVPPAHWQELRNGEGEKYFWREELLPRIEKWYRGKKLDIPQPLKEFTINTLKEIGGKQLYSHDGTISGKVFT